MPDLDLPSLDLEPAPPLAAIQITMGKEEADLLATGYALGRSMLACQPIWTPDGLAVILRADPALIREIKTAASQFARADREIGDERRDLMAQSLLAFVREANGL